MTIVEYLTSIGIQLHRHSRGYKCKCPIHDDRNPSLFVFTDRGREDWYCFGCQEGGDLHSLVCAIEGVEFKEAVAKVGPPPPRTDTRVDSDPSSSCIVSLSDSDSLARWLGRVRGLLFSGEVSFDEADSAYMRIWRSK